MTNKKHRSIASVNDRNLHHDGKNYIYADIFTGNRGYILTSNDTEKFAFFSSRYALALSVGVLLFFITNKTLLAIVLAIAVCIGSEIAFRTTFLSKLPMIENYNRPKAKSIVDNLIDKQSKIRLILMSIFLAGIIVLIPINTKYQGYEGVLLYCNYLIMAGMAIYEIFVLIALIKKIKMEK